MTLSKGTLVRAAFSGYDFLLKVIGKGEGNGQYFFETVEVYSSAVHVGAKISLVWDDRYFKVVGNEYDIE